jgi:hypothetical protein
LPLAADQRRHQGVRGVWPAATGHLTPVFHALVAGALGAGVYQVSGCWEAGAATFVAGVIPDADHLLDLYNWSVRRQTHRLFYLLHGWEYLALSLLATVLHGGRPSWSASLWDMPAISWATTWLTIRLARFTHGSTAPGAASDVGRPCPATLIPDWNSYIPC